MWRWNINHAPHPWTTPSPRGVHPGAVICSGDEEPGERSGRAWKQTLGHLHRLFQGPRYPEFALKGGGGLQVHMFRAPWTSALQGRPELPLRHGAQGGVVVA